MKSETLVPFTAFVKHILSLDFMKEDHKGLRLTFQNIIIILESDKYVPTEISKAVSAIQDIAEKREDPGLAAVLLGLAQGKTLLKQARTYADQLSQKLAFLQTLCNLSEKTTEFTIPNEFCCKWSEMANVFNQGCLELIELQNNPATESSRGVISTYRKSLGDFAISVCSSFGNHTASQWVEDMKSKWDSQEAISPCPKLDLLPATAKYNSLGSGPCEVLQLVSQLQTSMGLLHESWTKSKDGSLDTETAINSAKQFESFLKESGPRLVYLKHLPITALDSLAIMKKSMHALSESRVSKAAAVHAESLGEVMCKAGQGNNWINK